MTVDEPWADRGPLNYGMIKQRLEALSCSEVMPVTSTSMMWEGPNGFRIVISMTETDGEMLAAIVRGLTES